jgi:hypothetical protein
MFQFSMAHWCERRIGAASGQAGPEVWPSRTHAQNGKRLAAYGGNALVESRKSTTPIVQMKRRVAGRKAESTGTDNPIDIAAGARCAGSAVRIKSFRTSLASRRALGPAHRSACSPRRPSGYS